MADALLDFGATYSGDTFTATSQTQTTQYFYNVSALFALDRSMRWTVGWTFFGISKAETAESVTSNYSSLDMGPALRWNIDKGNMFSLTGAYGYLAKGIYTLDSVSERWEGTSLFGQFAVQIPVQEGRLSLGLSLNYYAASYSKKIVNSVESTHSAQKSWIFPMLSLTWRL